MLDAHPAFVSSRSGLDAGVSSEYPGSLVLDAVSHEDGAIRVLVDLGLDRREACGRRFAWVYAGVTGAGVTDVMYGKHHSGLLPYRITARPLLDELVGLLVNLDREALHRFFYAHAWVEVAMNAVVHGIQFNGLLVAESTALIVVFETRA